MSRSPRPFVVVRVRSPFPLSTYVGARGRWRVRLARRLFEAAARLLGHPAEVEWAPLVDSPSAEVLAAICARGVLTPDEVRGLEAR